MIEMNTNEYEFSHGRTPRGNGYWGFDVRRFGVKVAEVWHHGTFAEARKEAKRIAKEHKATDIKVMP